MPIDIAGDLWSELKRYISIVDRSEAADVLVNLLIDNDYDAEDIRTVFKGDSDVRQALLTYLADDETDFEEQDDDTDDDLD